MVGGPAGDGGTKDAARRGRRALRVGAEGPINHLGQPGHSEALAAAGARDGVGIGAETIKKGGLPPRVPGERLAKRKAREEELVKFGFCPMTEECGTGYGVRGLAEGPARVLVGGGGFLRRTV